MRISVERTLFLPVASTLVACFALPASLSFARHRQLQPGARRLACEAFVADEPRLTARAGDTLWSLTERNTGKPWVWPQVWTLNPELTNPHVLAVGQVVHFAAHSKAAAPAVHSAMPVASDESLAEATEPDSGALRGPAGDASAAAKPQGATPGAPPASPSNAPQAAAEKAASLPASPSPAAAPADKQGRTDTAPLLPAALFSKAEWQRFGTVVASTQEGLLGQAGERLRVRWHDQAVAQAGPFVIVRSPDGWPTNDDGHATGIMATCTGVALAQANNPREVVVASVREEIEIGQRVVPMTWMQEPSRVTQVCDKHVCGRLVGNEHVAIVGNPLHVVFFNRGTTDGLKIGDLLIGEGQGVGHTHRPLLRVLRAGEHHATLSAVSTTQELVHGQALCTATQAQAQALAATTSAAP